MNSASVFIILHNVTCMYCTDIFSYSESITIYVTGIEDCNGIKEKRTSSPEKKWTIIL